MIHQLIFARAKPGMNEEEFQDYWLKVHAIEFASKITQIKKYKIDRRIPLELENDQPLWHGVAEIWLNNEEEQLASLQSEEFVQGARIDETKWAAFWQTVVLDTTTHELLKGTPETRDSSAIKMLILVKRKEGMPLTEFHQYSLENHALKVLKIPGLLRYSQCHVRDSFYIVGEAILDSVFMLWFDNVDTLQKASESSEYSNVKSDLANFVNPKYVHTLITDENWIIGPEPRA